MEDLLKLSLTAIFSGAFAASIVSVIFKRKTELITGEIKNQFDLLSISQKTGHAWKEKAVSELYGPLCFQFTRTQNAFKRYHEKNIFLEANILKEGNEKIKNLLLEKSYLISPDLMDDADALVQHYDVWLEEFSKLRETENPTEKKNFVFAGPKGFPFPKAAEKKFREKYLELWNNLYV